MPFNWNEYSGDSDTEDVSLLLSIRSQSLILAAMQALEFRSGWLDVDDSTWDEIDAAVGEAYEEIMEIIPPVTIPKPIGLWRSTAQNGLAASGWQTLVYSKYDDPLVALSANPLSGNLFFAEDGWVRVNAVINARNAATAQSNKQLRIRDVDIDTPVVYGVIQQINASAAVRAWSALNSIFEVVAGTEYRIELGANSNSNTDLFVDTPPTGGASHSISIDLTWYPLS